jgi:hypothetical protein
MHLTRRFAVPKAVRAIIGDGRNEVAANLESEAG